MRSPPPLPSRPRWSADRNYPSGYAPSQVLDIGSPPCGLVGPITDQYLEIVVKRLRIGRKGQYFPCGAKGGAKGTRTPDPHTASVKPGVLTSPIASSASRSVHVGRLFLYSCVQCVFASDRES
jgi:hypothetical protein